MNVAFRVNSVGWICLAVFTAFEALPAAPPPDVVRNDWYLRASLGAIRDWDALIARVYPLKEKTPQPVFPVPLDGNVVAWPNPIPLRFWPAAGPPPRVTVRLDGGAIQVERMRPGENPARQSVPASEAVLSCAHPGGGGKEWIYAAIERRFERLTVARPQAAPLAVDVAGHEELGRGRSELTVTVRNASSKRLTAALRVDFHAIEEDRALAERTVTLPPGATEACRISVEIRQPGGGLMVVRVGAEGDVCWMPLFTYAEDVAGLLSGIEQARADLPDAAAAQRLDELKREAAAWETALWPVSRPSHPADRRSPDSLETFGREFRRGQRPAPSADVPDPAAWRSLFEQASALRDQILLARIPFDRLAFVKRKPFVSDQPYMDAHHKYNPPGGGIYVLSPVRPDGRGSPVVDSLGDGIYRDICLHWEGDRLLFAFGNGQDPCEFQRPPSGSTPQSYHVYEVCTDGRRLRQLTTGPKNDCEPFYLPNGQIGFTSDRSEHYVMCGGNIHAPTLHVADGDGGNVRRLSFNVFNDMHPCVMPDGRILYTRWEYNERSVTSVHNPFTMRPDGSMVATFFGNSTIVPNVYMYPRPVPGSGKVMALFTSHHGQTHGAVGLIDIQRGVEGRQAICTLTPKVPVTGERVGDSWHGWYNTPQPLSEAIWLCAFTPTARPWLANTWGLYVADAHGNLALVYRDAEISCVEPVPLTARRRPAAIPPQRFSESTAGEATEATLVLADVHVGLTGVPRGTPRYLRVLEDVPRQGVAQGGIITTAGPQIFTVKRVLGTVPIENDGSAHFAVPADRNLYFEVLDADRREIQRMRSVVCLRPGEARTCIGCHEPRNTAPPPATVAAVRRPPSRPVPPPWGTQTFSFLRDVQPVLNAKCVRCHTHDRPTARVILTDDLTDRFVVAYEDLLPYLSLARVWRFDHPDDVRPRPAYSFGSKVSRLADILAAGHHDVTLTDEERERIFTWIDTNGAYYDRYEFVDGNPQRWIFTGAVRETLFDVYARRCGVCHGPADKQQHYQWMELNSRNWWLNLNRRDVSRSRMLLAPLARAAGGWQRCGDPVFADAADADYQKLRACLIEAWESLCKRPRADLLSIRGTEAERQESTVPAPPPPRPPAFVNGGITPRVGGVYQGTEDAEIMSGYRDENAGQRTDFSLGNNGGGSLHRTLIRFGGLDALRGKTVRGAQLELTVKSVVPGAGENTIEAFALRDSVGDWKEGTAAGVSGGPGADDRGVTWNRRNQTNHAPLEGPLWKSPGLGAGADYDPIPIGSVAVTGTEPPGKLVVMTFNERGRKLIQQWVSGGENAGFLLKATGESTNAVIFWSSQAAEPARRPRLAVHTEE
jgi:hypothetical protein